MEGVVVCQCAAPAAPRLLVLLRVPSLPCKDQAGSREAKSPPLPGVPQREPEPLPEPLPELEPEPEPERDWHGSRRVTLSHICYLLAL